MSCYHAIPWDLSLPVTMLYEFYLFEGGIDYSLKQLAWRSLRFRKETPETTCGVGDLATVKLPGIFALLANKVFKVARSM